MLSSLSIRDIVLIERLDLELDGGLCVLTGETGAGKSILLDALGLVLGARAERGLVRQGAGQASVSAVFDLPEGDAVNILLAEHGIEVEDLLLIRRSLSKDGRSRAFVNDHPVGTTLLKRLGDLLVEVHGQHDQQGLFDPAMQRDMLDGFGRLDTKRAAVRSASRHWRDAEAERAKIEADIAKAASDVDYWRHIRDELDELAPEAGEEESLAEARGRLMSLDKLLAAIKEAMEALDGDGGSLASRLGRAQRALERVLEGATDVLEPAATALDRVRVELDEAHAALEQAADALQAGDERLEDIEERLFALRAAARKHKCQVHDLPGFRDDVAQRLAGIEAGDARLEEASVAAKVARDRFIQEAEHLTKGREKAAKAMAKAVMEELPPLKLEKARFEVRLIALSEAEWNEKGAERVQFEVATNPGQKPGALAKIASGGELARLMLAIKVVLARGEATPSMIFDEVDSGIGGATADAVGDRLAKLGEHLQVLVVTHAPQVAARADLHLRVEKQVRGQQTKVTVKQLAEAERREEVARMLAGAEITEAARAAADSLIRRSA